MSGVHTKILIGVVVFAIFVLHLARQHCLGLLSSIIVESNADMLIELLQGLCGIISKEGTTRCAMDRSVGCGMADASAEVDLVLEWDGDPQSFELDKLNGTYTASAESGRFLNLEPGSGKLLGLFNIEALSRRFSLDFSDIFSKGLTFDQINGRGDISSGNLYSDELFVVAPLALIQITGRTGLKAEDYDLKVVVAPRLGSQISMLSALANPVAGAVVFLAYQVFSKQLSQMIQYEYKITGSWETPDIISVRKEPGPTDEDTSNR